MIAIALALGASACWGAADFLGGIKTRRISVVAVLFVMYAAALVVTAAVVAVSGHGLPSRGAAVAGLLAGVAGIVALGSFYQALAIGTMSIVAPIAATGVSLPVVVGILGGDSPSALASVGLPVAVVGVILASREPADATFDRSVQDPVAQRRAVLLALLAGFGFGAYFVAAEIGSRESVPWTLLLTRVSAVPVLLAGLLVTRARVPGRPLEVVQLASIGMLDLGAHAFFNLATTQGELSSVAVAGSLYPVVTVLLAALLLGERLRGVQGAGAAAALVGVLLIAAG